MSSISTVDLHSTPVLVGDTADFATTVYVNGSTVYFKATSDVSSVSNDGSVADGGNQVITEATYFVSAGNSRLTIDSVSASGYTTVEDEGTPLTQRSNLNFVGANVSAADSGGKTVVTVSGQPLDATLTSLAAFNTNGLLTQTAADTFTGRTLTGTTGQITVTDGDGVAGNPTISLPASISQATTFSAAGTALTVTNNALVSGNLTVTGTITGKVYTTVQDEGSPLTQRNTINFVGAGVSAADSGGVTTVTIAGGGSFPLAGTGAATTTDMITVKVTGDTQQRFILNADGTMEWGPGNATQDTNLYRSAADTLTTDDEFKIISPSGAASLTIQGANNGGSNTFRIFDSNGTTKKAYINKDGAFVSRQTIEGSGLEPAFYAQIPTSASSAVFGSNISSTVDQFRIYADGKMEWGTTNTARDTNLYRSAADTLKTDDSLVVTGTLKVGTQQTYTVSNVTTDRSYDANATTIDELADVLGSLIADLRTIGLVL